MPVLASNRDAIFTKAEKIAFQIGDFPDFYALIGTPRAATRAEIDSAITSRAADLLAASFSRGGKGEYLQLLERHVPDFRAVLLDKTIRRAYDEELRRHESGDARAMPFEIWKQTHVASNRLSRGLKTASRGLKARLRAAFWESEYF